MRQAFAILAVVLSAVALAAAEAPKPPNPYESPAPPTAASEIDRIVFAKLASLGIEPVLCSDAVFGGVPQAGGVFSCILVSLSFVAARRRTKVGFARPRQS